MADTFLSSNGTEPIMLNGVVFYSYPIGYQSFHTSSIENARQNKNSDKNGIVRAYIFQYFQRKFVTIDVLQSHSRKVVV